MLMTIRIRLLASLLLTPAVVLLLVWIGRFAGTDEVARVGILQFLFWSLGVGFGIASTITLYIAYLFKSAAKE